LTAVQANGTTMSPLEIEWRDRWPEQANFKVKSFRSSRCSALIHSGHFYSASPSPLLLRSAQDTAQILCRSFTLKRHRQLQVKDLPKVPTWRQERLRLYQCATTSHTLFICITVLYSVACVSRNARTNPESISLYDQRSKAPSIVKFYSSRTKATIWIGLETIYAKQIMAV